MEFLLILKVLTLKIHLYVTFYSLFVKYTIDPKYLFLHFSCVEYGVTQDWMQSLKSSLAQLLFQRIVHLDIWIAGDKGYICLGYLLTPWGNPEISADIWCDLSSYYHYTL